MNRTNLECFLFFFNSRKNHQEENEQTPGSRFEPRTLLLWCNSDNHWSILLPLLYCRLIKDSWGQHKQKVGKGCRKFVMVMDVKHEITICYISNLTLNIFINITNKLQHQMWTLKLPEIREESLSWSKSHHFTHLKSWSVLVRQTVSVGGPAGRGNNYIQGFDPLIPNRAEYECSCQSWETKAVKCSLCGCFSTQWDWDSSQCYGRPR